MTYALGEAPEDAMTRARAAGVLLVPEVLLPELWKRLALAQQSTLTAM